jgi:hypothetical protein
LQPQSFGAVRVENYCIVGARVRLWLRFDHDDAGRVGPGGNRKWWLLVLLACLGVAVIPGDQALPWLPVQLDGM